MKYISKLLIFTAQALMVLELAGCASTNLASNDENTGARQENEMATGSNFLKKSAKNSNVKEVDKDTIMDSVRSAPIDRKNGG